MLKENSLHFDPESSPVVPLASGICIAVGCLVLIGWCLDIEIIKSGLLTDTGTMKANTALCFVLSGVSLWSQFRGAQDSVFWRIVVRVCALAVSLIGWLTLAQYLLQWNLGIDSLLFRDIPSAPGRMGLNTAVNFILVGRAFGLLGQKTERSYCYTQVLALIAAVISLQAAIGYAYKVEFFYSIVPNTTSMTLDTAVLSVVLCVGILWEQKDKGLMRIVTKNTYGGQLTRRLLIAAIAVPLVLGWLIVQGLEAQIYEPAFAISLFTIILIVSFVVLIWQNATLIEGLSNQRDRAKVELKEKEEKLKSLVDANIIGILFSDVNGGIQQANDKLLQMIGYTREDLQAGKIDWKDITPPEYLYLDEQGIAEAKVNGACTPYEKEYIRKDDSRVPILIGYVLVGDQREEAVAFILDLTASKLAEEALRQSEERFRLAVDNIPDVFAIYDKHRRFGFVNLALLQRVSKSNEEVIGRTDEEIFPKEVTETYLPTLIQAQETRTLQTTEATVNLPNYGAFTSAIKYVPILDENGEIYQILAFADDITARKQAEETMLNQQKWLEYLLNLMPTPLVLIQPGTAQVTFANRAADEVAGGKFPLADSAADYLSLYHSTDAAGNIIPPENAPGIRVASGDRLEGFELDWHTPAGIRSLLIYADTLPAMHGHSATCVLTFQDISNLKRVEKALSVGYQRLQLLFNTASDLLSSQQPAALVDSVFRKLKEQIGLDVYFNYLVNENQEILQLESYSGITAEVAKEFEWLKFGQAVCGTVAQERRAIAVENVQQSTDPKTVYIRSVGITAYYSYPLIAQGQLLGTLSFGSRSRSVFTQNEIGMMQAVCDQIAIAMERASLIASLQQQTQQLTEANRMKDEFLAILSHELRSPLNAILGWAQLLRSRKLSESQIDKGLETIERNARAQTQLIEDLLDISRIIRAKLHLVVRTCDLLPIIQAALDTVRLAAQAKNIQIHTKLSETTGLISGDPERLQQVVWNLLSNAIKFTADGGSVEVELQRVEESYAQIQVKDTGIGISPKFLPYVFDRFRQADSSSTRIHGGLGLGLAIVRHLVEMHGGTVSVESLGEGKGATFTIKLPLVKQSQETPESPTPQEKASPASPSLQGVRVLVVDDETDSRDYITTVLQQCQAQVLSLPSVQSALEAMEKWKPDVLVSDIGMPEEDGYSLIRKVRSLPPDQGGKIPAAALTAYARPEDRRRAIQAGFQLHLPKPVDPAELATVVASLVGRT